MLDLNRPEQPQIVQAPEDALDLQNLTLPEGMPERARICITLKALGLSVKTIAEHLGNVSEQTVRAYLRKYDPTQIAAQVSERRKLYLSAMFEQIALETLSKVKAKDLQDLGVKQRIELSMMCVRAMKEIGAKRPEDPPLNEEELVSGLARGTMQVDTGLPKNESTNLLHAGPRDSGATTGDSGSAGSVGVGDGQPDDGPTDGTSEDSDGPGN